MYQPRSLRPQHFSPHRSIWPQAFSSGGAEVCQAAIAIPQDQQTKQPSNPCSHNQLLSAARRAERRGWARSPLGPGSLSLSSAPAVPPGRAAARRSTLWRHSAAGLGSRASASSSSAATPATHRAWAGKGLSRERVRFAAQLSVDFSPRRRPKIHPAPRDLRRASRTPGKYS